MEVPSTTTNPVHAVHVTTGGYLAAGGTIYEPVNGLVFDGLGFSKFQDVIQKTALAYDGGHSQGLDKGQPSMQCVSVTPENIWKRDLLCSPTITWDVAHHRNHIWHPSSFVRRYHVHRHIFDIIFGPGTFDDLTRDTQHSFRVTTWDDYEIFEIALCYLYGQPLKDVSILRRAQEEDLHRKCRGLYEAAQKYHLHELQVDILHLLDPRDSITQLLKSTAEIYGSQNATDGQHEEFKQTFGQYLHRSQVASKWGFPVEDATDEILSYIDIGGGVAYDIGQVLLFDKANGKPTQPYPNITIKDIDIDEDSDLDTVHGEGKPESWPVLVMSVTRGKASSADLNGWTIDGDWNSTLGRWRQFDGTC